MSFGRRVAIACCVVGGALGCPAVAQAYQVQISITGAGQVTETTPADLVGSSCASPSSTPTGALGKTCAAGTFSGAYNYGWDVDYVATPSPGYTFKHWTSTPGNSLGPVICDRSTPAATTSTYTGATCKFRTFADLQTRAVFEDVSTPAAPTVSASPAGPVGGAVTFNLAAASDPTFEGFECLLSNGTSTSPVSCSGDSVTLNPSGSGNYTLTVRSVDFSDNKSSGVQRTFTVDKTAPVTTLGASGPAQDSTTSSKSASFSFGSSESGSFRCSLDGASPAACSGSGTQSYSNLGEGPHVFRVFAVDGVGNVDSTPEERRWTVDSVAPETTLDPAAGPAEGATTASDDAIFQFSSNEPGAGFHCSLDGLELAQCDTPRVLSDLGDGPHVFRVWAEDAAGNADASPAERSWTVDTSTQQDPPGDPLVVPPTQYPVDPLGPGETESAACEDARKKLKAAKAKLAKLKKARAPRAKIAKAKKKFKKLAQAAAEACSTG